MQVNNSGIGKYEHTLEITKEKLDETFFLNVYGAIWMVKHVIPNMPEQGRIINISSITSKIGMGGMPFYGASKAALDSLTYAWAQEVSEIVGENATTD
jgi:NAD(P)-dependent dehydrogenase (short-subunit alcohol dehydrogenase family)